MLSQILVASFAVITESYTKVLGAGFGVGDALPGFGAAEGRDADVAAEIEGVSVELHGGFVGFAGHGVVDVAAGGVVSVGSEAGADFEVTQGARAERRVRVVGVDGAGSCGGQGDDAEAEGVGAGSETDDGATRGFPVAGEAVGVGCEDVGGVQEQSGGGDGGAGDERACGHGEVGYAAQGASRQVRFRTKWMARELER